MTELEKTESGRSWRRQRATSRPSRPITPRLQRLCSGQHRDDQSYYHHDDYHQYTDGDSQSTLASDTVEEEQNEDREAEREREEEPKEVRDGILDEPDLESRGPPLEKNRTTRSVKPENLVRPTRLKATFEADFETVGNMGWA